MGWIGDHKGGSRIRRVIREADGGISNQMGEIGDQKGETSCK